MAVAEPEMQIAIVLALHTGQRQGDILRLAWSNYNPTHLALRQGKSRRADKPGRLVKRSTLILRGPVGENVFENVLETDFAKRAAKQEGAKDAK